MVAAVAHVNSGSGGKVNGGSSGEGNDSSNDGRNGEGRAE